MFWKVKGYSSFRVLVMFPENMGLLRQWVLGDCSQSIFKLNYKFALSYLNTDQSQKADVLLALLEGCPLLWIERVLR